MGFMFSPFNWRNENTRTKWGYTFQWTEKHHTAEDLYPMKYTYDTLGEECLSILDQISPPLTTELPRNQSRAPEKENSTIKPKRDLYELLKAHASEDETLNKLWTEVNTVPEWVDWNQISRGQEVFYRYGGVALFSLAFHSLLGGMAAGRVTEVLGRTGGFSPKVARGRMFETTQHILQVTQSLESIKPGGAGHQSSIRVRLLHAAVRRRILTLAKTKPEYYSVEEFGVPINDLDSIATIATFSSTLVWASFPRQGIFLRKREIEDYLALWRLVAYYVGAPSDDFSTPDRAKCMMESLLMSEMNPTAMSRVLANNIILSLQNKPPTYPSIDFLNASTRWLNGNELSDALGIGNPSLYYKILVAGQCLFFMAVCYTYRSVPSLDRKKIARLRTIIYRTIITSKTFGLGAETDFSFKYIPEYDTTTLIGAYELSEKEKGMSSYMEKRSLRTLLIAGVFGGCVAWVGVLGCVTMFRGVGGFWR